MFFSKKMQHGKNNSLLLVGEKNTLKSSLLLQFASHWAEAGVRVSYLSSIPFSELPPPVHGATFPSSNGLNQIQFIYLPRWQDLLQHLFSLHCHALVPRAIILQGLDHYCTNTLDTEDPNNSVKADADGAHIALICAALLDALSVCSTRNGNKESFCICTYERSFGESDSNFSSFISPLSAFFNNIWFVQTIPTKCSEGKSSLICAKSCNCQFVSIKKVLHHCKELETGSSLEFLCKSSAIFLQKVLEIIRV